jgi:dihydrolipoamide dehydrogenase
MADKYDLIVIGAGPGGYVAAIRAAQLGLKTAVVEKDKPGGVCLNVGCIPSKSLINSAAIYESAGDLESFGLKIDRAGFDYSKVQARSAQAASRLSKGVEFLLKKNKIDYISGHARLAGGGKVKVEGAGEFTAKNILLATGSRPREIPGFQIDEKKILSSTGALALTELPKSILILGAGAIGVEFAHVFGSFGVNVVLVEMLDRILPLEDEEVVEVLRRAFKKRKIEMRTGTKAVGYKKSGKGLEVELESESGKEKIKTDMVLVAVGRSPNSEDLGLDAAGVKTEKGWVTVGDHYRTSAEGIYAVGDVTGQTLLAHAASHQGEMVVEHIAGEESPVSLDPDLIPRAIYCEPQVAGFGPTEKEAADAGRKFKKSVFPYRGVGKAVATEKIDGMVKILSDEESGELIACHIVGAEATELIHELMLAKSSELLAEDVGGSVHAHPTLSEAVMEAAKGIYSAPIHI